MTHSDDDSMTSIDSPPPSPRSSTHDDDCCSEPPHSPRGPVSPHAEAAEALAAAAALLWMAGDDEPHPAEGAAAAALLWMAGDDEPHPAEGAAAVEEALGQLFDDGFAAAAPGSIVQEYTPARSHRRDLDELLDDVTTGLLFDFAYDEAREGDEEEPASPPTPTGNPRPRKVFRRR